MDVVSEEIAKLMKGEGESEGEGEGEWGRDKGNGKSKRETNKTDGRRNEIKWNDQIKSIGKVSKWFWGCSTR